MYNVLIVEDDPMVAMINEQYIITILTTLLTMHAKKRNRSFRKEYRKKRFC